MKKIFFLSSSLLGMLFLLLTESIAQWKQISPSVGTVYHFAFLPDSSFNKVLYAWTSSGLLSSKNLGLDWQTDSRFFPDNHTVIARTLKKNDSILYAANDNNILISTNLGKDWNTINPPTTFQYSGRISSLAAYVDSNDVTFLFAGTTTKGVYLTTNNGATWTPMNNGLGSYVSSLAIYTNQHDTTFIYAGTWGGGIYVTTDNGNNWNPLNEFYRDWYISALAVSPTANGGFNIYAGTGTSGIFCSSNNGASWSQISTGLTNAWVNALVADSTIILVGTKYGGIYRSTNYGSSWFSANNGFTNVPINSICYSNGFLFAATYWQGVFRSSNLGSTWEFLNSNLFYTIRACNISGHTLIAGADWGSLFYSTDDGTNWTSRKIDLKNSLIRAIETHGSTLYAASSDGIFYSTNKGENWTYITPPGIYPTAIGAFATSLRQGSQIYIVVATVQYPTNHITIREIYTSTDNGKNWIFRKSGLAVSVIKARNNDIFVGTFENGIYHSSTAGISWTQVNSGLSDPRIRSIAILDTNVFVGTENGVFLSTNNGASWSEINTGLPPNMVISAIELAPDENLIFVGTKNGVWKRTLSELISIRKDDNPNLPCSFVLEQNYPNPFNQETKIEYKIPEQGWVTIKIFDILGREIETLVNEQKPPGNYTVRWNATGMPSGIYFYRLQAGMKTITKKLILIK